VTDLLRERLGAAALFDPLRPCGGEPVLPGFLGAASAVVVTCDSVAMLSDTAAVGRPIHGWRLPGGKAKFDRLFRALKQHGALRRFDGSLQDWTYRPLDAAGTVAAAIRVRL